MSLPWNLGACFENFRSMCIRSWKRINIRCSFHSYIPSSPMTLLVLIVLFILSRVTIFMWVGGPWVVGGELSKSFCSRCYNTWHACLFHYHNGVRLIVFGELVGISFGVVDKCERVTLDERLLLHWDVQRCVTKRVVTSWTTSWRAGDMKWVVAGSVSDMKDMMIVQHPSAKLADSVTHYLVNVTSNSHE